MYNRQLMAVSFVLLMMILGLLVFLSHLPENVIISIAIIILFLIIFTYIFSADGHILLRGLLIVTSFIALPVLIFVYLGIFDAFPQFWQAILALAAVVLTGAVSIFTIVGLNIVELTWD